MSQSLAKNYVHIVFHTKNSEDFIYEPFESELYKYIATVCNDLSCYVVQVGGYRNHVHILCNLARTVAMMDLLEKIKSSSSKWFKALDPSLENFYWQDGYGAFFVSPQHVEIVKNYISNQHEHHHSTGFKEEYIKLLVDNGMEYDKKYLWD
jgi:REP element-mobilizing transposase RayT